MARSCITVFCILSKATHDLLFFFFFSNETFSSEDLIFILATSKRLLRRAARAGNVMKSMRADIATCNQSVVHKEAFVLKRKA